MKNIKAKHLLFPALWFILAMILLSLVMEHGHKVGIPTAGQSTSAVVFGIILIFAPVVIWVIGYTRRYSGIERILSALLPVLWWWITEVATRMMGGHSLLEGIYLTFFIVNIGQYLLYFFLLVITEIICRLVHRIASSQKIKIFSRPVWMSLVLALLILISTPFWATAYFGGFLNGYRNLFMGETFEPFLRELEEREVPAVSVPVQDSTRDRPNIVFILSDDHRWDYMSNMNHPFVQTPNMDKLFAQGVRFNNAFVNASLCSPSRASFLTGQYPQKHGVFNNFTPWNNKNQTFFEYLKQAGYATAFIGKWHMPGGLPTLRGVDEFVTFTVVGGQGQYWNCPLIVNGQEEPSRKPYITEELTDRSLAFIERNQDQDQPFVLYLSHKSVHAPFSPDSLEAGDYGEQEIDLPDHSHNYTNLTNGRYVHFMFSPLKATIKKYGEAVTSMDRQVGRVMDRIEELGLTENTVFIYTSDNGQLWGEHREIDKRFSTEESIRIPWLMRYPRLLPQGGQQRNEMVLNVDLFPTLLDLAGIQPPSSVQGRSLLPLLQNQNAEWREDFYYNYFYEPPYTVPTVHSIRTDRYKYNEYEVKDPELFDLQEDPREQHNLLEEEGNAALQNELRERMEALKREIVE
jgi:arylsulfatase A-like enzyme